MKLLERVAQRVVRASESTVDGATHQNRVSTSPKPDAFEDSYCRLRVDDPEGSNKHLHLLTNPATRQIDLAASKDWQHELGQGAGSKAEEQDELNRHKKPELS